MPAWLDNLKEGAMSVEEQPLQDLQTKGETEAGDLRELHLSATFLTPYAVAPSQEHDVWLTNTQEAYIDHTKQGERRRMASARVALVVGAALSRRSRYRLCAAVESCIQKKWLML